MQMTHTLKALVAAVSMTLALGAHAAQISSDQLNLGSNVGGGTGAGSLVLAMVDGANGICLHEEWHFSRAVIAREANAASRRVKAAAEIWKHEGH